MDYNNLVRLNKITLQKLDSLSYEGEGVLAYKMIDLFISNSLEKIISIEKDLANLDFKQAAKSVHNVKSGAQILGADRFSSLCVDLEVKCHNKDSGAISAFENLKVEHSLLKVELESLRSDISKKTGLS